MKKLKVEEKNLSQWARLGPRAMFGKFMLDIAKYEKKLIIKGGKSPQFIAVEGPIGVGKTTLAKRLANTFSCETLL